jgi:hypothetical protein
MLPMPRPVKYASRVPASRLVQHVLQGNAAHVQRLQAQRQRNYQTEASQVSFAGGQVTNAVAQNR